MMNMKMSAVLSSGNNLVWGLLGGVLGAAVFAWVAPAQPAIATVDLQRLVQVARADLVTLATDNSLGESSAAGIEGRLTQFGVKLDAAVKRVGAQHGVVIIQSQAIASSVGSGVLDLTDEVERALYDGEGGQ